MPNIRLSVDYEDGVTLPIFHAVPEGASRGVMLVHGGNDSYMKEFLMPLLYLREHGYEVYLYEGPGQGSVIRDQGCPFTWQWEKTTKAITERFDLHDVTIVGISLGGYFAPRAAAFDKRIARVVCWSIYPGTWDLVEGAAGKAAVKVLGALPFRAVCGYSGCRSRRCVAKAGMDMQDNGISGKAPARAGHARRYAVTRLYGPDGSVAPHFVGEEFHRICDSWETAMAMPQFAAVIERELEAEKVADAPLEHLAAFAPSKRVRGLFLQWLAFMDDELDPWTTGGAIHFRPHWARVLLHALSIADEMELADSDLEALAMAAVFHDTRRQTPYLDTGHGARAAAYYEECCAAAGPDGPLHLDPRAALAMAWHDRDDADGADAARRLSAETGNGPNADPLTILWIFKDSDALDRVRLGEGGLDARYLRTEAAKGRIAFAQEVFEAT